MDPILVLGLSASVAVGSYFRLNHLLSQIPVHDEWHALEAVAFKGFAAIATNFGANDYSIPIALYFEAVARTIGLEEVTFRAPFAVVSCAGLALLPVLASRYLTTTSTMIFAWFLAISPMLVFYGRTARPYGITVVTSLAAVFLFDIWWSEGNKRAAAGYVALCIATGWALLVHLPFALAPAGVGIIRGLLSPSENRGRLLRLSFMMALILGCLALLVGPALLNDWSTLASKSGSADFEKVQFWPSAVAAFGMVGRKLVWFFLVSAVIGAYSMYGSHRRFLTSLTIASIALIAGVFVVRPYNAVAPMVLTRYLLPVVTTLLLLAAVGAARMFGWLSDHSRPLAGALAGLTLVGPLVLGPLPSLASGPDSFTTFHLFVRMHYREQTLNRLVEPPPDFYRKIARNPWDSEHLILEAPYSGRQMVPYGFHQKFHRQRVVVGFTDGYCGEPVGGQIPTAGRSGLRFGNLFWLGDLEAIRNAKVTWIVLHRRSLSETPWPEKRYLGELDFESCLEMLSRDVGQPSYLDENIAAFDLSE
jgi:hypothetical protein